MKISGVISKIGFSVIAAIISNVAYAAESVTSTQSKAEYVDIMNKTAKLIEQRLFELGEVAKDRTLLLTEEQAVAAGFDLARKSIHASGNYVSINGVIYSITKDNTVEIPLRHWNDDSAIRNLFDFLGQDWELSQYQGGAVFVNKKFGNYDYGNGCLLEYYPNSSEIPNNYVNKDNGLIRELETCFDDSMGIGESGLVMDEANYLNPHHFGVHAQVANFIAIELYEELLITAHSPRAEHGHIANPVIGFFDTVSGDTEYINSIGKGRPYEKINDIRILGDKLYVSAEADQQRIDIFDIKTKSYQYSLSFENNGNNKIYVTEDKIFVTGNQGINVYPNTSVEIHEIKKISPIAQLKNTGAHSLELYGSDLLAFSGDSYSVYDISQLSEGIDLNPLVVRPSEFTAVDLKQNKLIAKQANRISFYDMNEFVRLGYSFNEASQAVYMVDKFEVWAKDLLLTDKGFIALTDSVITDVHTLNDITFTPGQFVEESTLSYRELPESARVSHLLKPDSVYSSYEISLNTNSMVSTRILDNKTVEITNYTEINLSDVKLDFQVKGQYSWARLGHIDFLPAYTRIVLPLKEFNSENTFNTVNGSGSYDFTSFIRNLEGDWGTYNQLGTKALFKSRFSTSTQDPLIEKLSQIDANWEIDFLNTYLGKPGVVWTGDMTKKHIEIIANLAYMISSAEFEKRLLYFREIYGYEMVIGGETLTEKEQYVSYLEKTRVENAFDNYVGLQGGFTPLNTMQGHAGTLFGLSEDVLEELKSGDQSILNEFVAYVVDQLLINYYGSPCDVPPSPCGTDIYERDLKKVVLDTLSELSQSGSLPYNL